MKWFPKWILGTPSRQYSPTVGTFWVYFLVFLGVLGFGFEFSPPLFYDHAGLPLHPGVKLSKYLDRLVYLDQKGKIACVKEIGRCWSCKL